jgi:hypothetical protein
VGSWPVPEDGVDLGLHGTQDTGGHGDSHRRGGAIVQVRSSSSILMALPRSTL